jgi:hypothetical protein
VSFLLPLLLPLHHDSSDYFVFNTAQSLARPLQQQNQQQQDHIQSFRAFHFLRRSPPTNQPLCMATINTGFMQRSALARPAQSSKQCFVRQQQQQHSRACVIRHAQPAGSRSNNQR